MPLVSFSVLHLEAANFGTPFLEETGDIPLELAHDECSLRLHIVVGILSKVGFGSACIVGFDRLHAFDGF